MTDQDALTIPFATSAQRGNMPDAPDEWLNWLMQLSSTASVQVTEPLLQQLNKFCHAEISPQQALWLHRALQAFDQLAARLEPIVLDVAFPLSASEQAHINMLTHGYATIASGYAQCLNLAPWAQADEAQKRTMIFALYHGLVALSKAEFYGFAVYQQPAADFWQASYRFFIAAEQFKVLDLPVNTSKPQSPGAVFKKIVLFYLADPLQLTPQEIKGLFHLLDSWSDGAQILTTAPEDYLKWLYGFATTENQPPVSLQYHHEHGERWRYVQTLKLAKAMRLAHEHHDAVHQPVSVIERTLLPRLAKTYGKAVHRKFTRIAQTLHVPGVIGYKNVINYLRALYAPPPRDSQGRLVDDYWQAPMFDLVKEGEEAVHNLQRHKDHAQLQKILKASQGLSDTAIWLEKRIEAHEELDSPTICELVILDSSIKGYGLALKNQRIKLRVGDLAAITTPDRRAEIGVIRRISQPGHEVHLGIELIAMDARVFFVQIVGRERAVAAIHILPSEPLHINESILVQNRRLLLGETLQFNETDAYHQSIKIRGHISKILPTSPLFSHAEFTRR